MEKRERERKKIGACGKCGEITIIPMKLLSRGRLVNGGQELVIAIRFSFLNYYFAGGWNS